MWGRADLHCNALTINVMTIASRTWNITDHAVLPDDRVSQGFHYVRTILVHTIRSKVFA